MKKHNFQIQTRSSVSPTSSFNQFPSYGSQGKHRFNPLSPHPQIFPSDILPFYVLYLNFINQNVKKISIISQGGLRAVVWTDFVQTFIMFGAMLLIVIKGTSDLGGLSVVIRRNLDSGRLEIPT